MREGSSDVSSSMKKWRVCACNFVRGSSSVHVSPSREPSIDAVSG
jgi:hypothetical protein